MLITLLAVTKVNSPDRFCIAGTTDNGKWIRPIPNDKANRFWLRRDLTRENGEFTKCGDVWEIEGDTPDEFQFPNHTEDFIITNMVIKLTQHKKLASPKHRH